MSLFSSPDLTVLMVCTANVCRSPMAEWILRAELGQQASRQKIAVDSAGTHVVMRGRPADPRAQQVCRSAGVETRKGRARQVQASDFAGFDYLMAMDEGHYRWLMDASPEAYRERIFMIGEWAPGEQPVEIPDPYFGSLQSFEQVFALLRASISGFSAYLLEGQSE